MDTPLFAWRVIAACVYIYIETAQWTTKDTPLSTIGRQYTNWTFYVWGVWLCAMLYS